MSDSNAWRQVRWMVLPALAGYGAMAGASDRDAFTEGRRVLQEAKRDFDKAPTPEGALALYSIATWLVTWAATTGSPPRDSDESTFRPGSGQMRSDAHAPRCDEIRS